MSNYLKTVQSLKDTKSRVEKEVILADADAFTLGILQRTYNPFMRYFITIEPEESSSCCSNGTLKGYWNEITFFLDKSMSRELSGNQQSDFIRNVLCRLSPEEGQVLIGMVNKDLSLGVNVKTINKVFKGLLPESVIMKAEPFDPSRLPLGALMSLKLDGIRARFHEGTLLTSGGNEIMGVGHIISSIKSLGYDSLDGELIVPGVPFQVSSGLLRSHKPTPGAELHVFDMPHLRVPLAERYSYLTDQSKRWPLHLKLVRHLPVKGLSHIQENYERALATGYEGLMIKDASGKYEHKRSFSWMKLKAQDPDEIVITGFKEGEGRLKGTLGSVIGRRKNGVEVSVSGFTDEERKTIWENHPLWLNEVLEVLCHEETPGGSFRHARFNRKEDLRLHRHRWDKCSSDLN